MYDGVADRFGDHARMCPCDGGRTKRLRAVLAARAQAVSFHTESSHLALTTPRGPTTAGLSLDAALLMSGLAAGVRIAQPLLIWLLLTGGCGRPCFHFALSLVAMLLLSINPGNVNTKTLRPPAWPKAYNFFPWWPRPAEGLGPTATQVWKALATAIAARSNESASVEHDRLLQALAVALQRANARAVLRRLGS